MSAEVPKSFIYIKRVPKSFIYIYIEREREIRYRETQGESLCYKPENTLTLFRYFFVFSVS